MSVSSKSSSSSYHAKGGGGVKGGGKYAPADDDDETESICSTTTSSTNESSVASSIDDVKLKLLQMKRANNKKLPQSRLLMKFKNFVSPEQRAKNELNKRIDSGIRACLAFHTPVELSSICGTLGLKALQRAVVSVESIIKYCKGSEPTASGEESEGGGDEDDDFNESKVLKVVNNMWEGALFEYLKSIGHPIVTSQDPKQTVMKVWRRGGFHEYDHTSFTPHYIQKRVLTRFDQEQSEDISSRQSKLQKLEKEIKFIERELFEEHNYQNALSFFQQLGEIRRLEVEFRDYLIFQLETARAQISRATSNVTLGHEMVKEIEERYLKGVSELNEKLSIYEVSYEDEMETRVKSIQQMALLEEVIQSMSTVGATHRQLLHSSSAVDMEETSRKFLLSTNSKWKTVSHESLVKCNRHLQNIYRTVTSDLWSTRQLTETLCGTVSSQAKEIIKLQKEVKRLSKRVEVRDLKIVKLEDAVLRREEEIAMAAREMCAMEVTHGTVRREAWSLGIRMTGRVNGLEEKLKAIETILKTGIQISGSSSASSGGSSGGGNRLLSSFCHGINAVLGVVPKETMSELYELGLMREEDRLSEMVREDEMRLALLSGGAKTKKKKKGVVKKGKGTGKKTSGGGKSAGKSSGGKKVTTGGVKKSAASAGATGGAKKTATGNSASASVKKPSKAVASKKKK
jgi:cell division protein FtsB